MKPRAVRIAMVDAVISYDGQPATLLNISRSGALLRLRDLAPIGTDGRLTITHAHITIGIDARVARTSAAPATAGGIDGDSHAGISFVAPPPPEITALLRRLISLG
jgi:hypothetical protein